MIEFPIFQIITDTPSPFPLLPPDRRTKRKARTLSSIRTSWNKQTPLSEEFALLLEKEKVKL